MIYMEVSALTASLFAILVVVLLIGIAGVAICKRRGCCKSEGFCGGRDQHCCCDGNEKFVPLSL